MRCQCCQNEVEGYQLNNLFIDSNELFMNVIKLNPELELEFHGDILYICDDCWAKVITYCPECHEKVAKGTLCSCYDDHIMNYHNKAIVFPKYSGHVKFPKLRFGLEIETKFHGDCSAHRKALGAFTKVLGRELCKFKYDGSLGPKGAEFVTMPLYYEHIINLKKKFTMAFDTYRSLGGYSWEDKDTGCHIHLSKDAFISRKHLETFYLGMTKNIRFIHRIAKRGENYWVEHPMKFFKFNKKFKNISQLAFAVTSGYKIDRHTFVNLNNKDTVEVRIYKGNLKWSSVMSYIQHCYSMFEYTMLCTLNKISFSIEGYKEYVIKNKTRFAELAKNI